MFYFECFMLSGVYVGLCRSMIFICFVMNYKSCRTASELRSSSDASCLLDSL